MPCHGPFVPSPEWLVELVPKHSRQTKWEKRVSVEAFMHQQVPHRHPNPFPFLITLGHPPLVSSSSLFTSQAMDRLTQLQDAIDKLALLFVSSLDHLTKNAPLVPLNPNIPVVNTGLGACSLRFRVRRN